MSAIISFRANENQNRYTRRQEQRRIVDALVRSDCLEVARRQLTTNEVEQLIRGILDNKVSEFGLIKLSVLNLNRSYSLGENEEQLTLLQYATMRGRDKIALALIRAGALPYVSEEGLIRGCVRDVAAQYVVWLMKFAKVRTTVDYCQICASSTTGCVQFDGCRHNVCLGCFWSQIHHLDSLHSEALQAVSTGVVWEGILDPIVCCLVCGEQACAEYSKHGASHTKLLRLAPNECRCKSFELYCLLPHSFSTCMKDNAVGKESGKDRTHRGLHLSEIARCNLGTTQSQRDEEFVKACMKGDLRRVAALVESGVHLDGADEYGMTALMQAAWLGRVHVCAMLLAAGADATLRDALGHTAPHIAHSAGHSEVVQLLVHNKIFNPQGHLYSLPEQAIVVANSVELHKMHQGKCAPPGLFSLFEPFVASSEECDGEVLNDPSVSILIPPAALCGEQDRVSKFWHAHGVKGAEPGAFCLDNCFHPAFLQNLLDIHASLTVAPSEKAHCASRSYFCDVEGRVTQCLEQAIRAAAVACQLWGARTETGPSRGESTEDAPKCGRTVRVFPQMRFLHYEHDGTALAPHVDLARRDVRDVNVKSTHTLILYLTDCATGGGETVLLKSLNCKSNKTASNLAVERERVAEGEDADRKTNSNVVASISPVVGRLLLFPHNCPHEGRAIDHRDPKLLLRGEVFISS